MSVNGRSTSAPPGSTTDSPASISSTKADVTTLFYSDDNDQAVNLATRDVSFQSVPTGTSQLATPTRATTSNRNLDLSQEADAKVMEKYRNSGTGDVNRKSHMSARFARLESKRRGRTVEALKPEDRIEVASTAPSSPA